MKVQYYSKSFNLKSYTFAWNAKVKLMEEPQMKSHFKVDYTQGFKDRIKILMQPALMLNNLFALCSKLLFAYPLLCYCFSEPSFFLFGTHFRRRKRLKLKFFRQNSKMAIIQKQFTYKVRKAKTRLTAMQFLVFK